MNEYEEVRKKVREGILQAFGIIVLILVFCLLIGSIVSQIYSDGWNAGHATGWNEGYSMMKKSCEELYAPKP